MINNIIYHFMFCPHEFCKQVSIYIVMTLLIYAIYSCLFEYIGKYLWGIMFMQIVAAMFYSMIHKYV